METLEDGRYISSLSIDKFRTELSARGGDPNHQGLLHTELRQIARALTNRL